MLTRKLGSVFRKQWVKCLSTNLSPKTINESPEEIISENNKENEILQNPDYFKVHNLFTVKDLFDAKVHYGHQEISVQRNMKPFVFGSRLGHIIFDLDITAYHLRQALNFTAHIAYRGGIILFISKNPRMTLLVENTAKACKEYAVTREWMFGTFTGGENLKSFMRLPDLCIFLNTLGEDGKQHFAIVEAAKMCIPTVGIVDSNCNPNLITYPVPGNDDSFSCFQLYCKLFKEAILRGKNEREKHKKNVSEPMENTKNEREEHKKNVSEPMENTKNEREKHKKNVSEPVENTKTVKNYEEISANIKTVLSNVETTENTKTVKNYEEISENIKTLLSNVETIENKTTLLSNEESTENTKTELSNEETTKKENIINSKEPILKNTELDTNVNTENVKEKVD